jgi:hypothetical protein
MKNTKNTEEISKKTQEIIGSLFNTIHYSSNEQLNLFIDGMNEEQAVYCLKEALIACHVRGAFTMEETEAVSKSLRLLKF